MCKWIWIKPTALCLCLLLGLPGMTAFADPGVEGAGANSEIKIEVVREKGRVYLTINVVDQESGNSLPDVMVDLMDPDRPDMPPITGSTEGIPHITDSKGKIVIPLFSNPDRRYQIDIRHIGYKRYVSDIFKMVEDVDVSRRVELVKQEPGQGNPSWDGGSYVYYHAGAGGKLDGIKLEWVPYGESPKDIPSPVPQEGYAFLGWTLQDKKVDPKELTVRKDINLRAVFELLPPPSASESPSSGTNLPAGSGIPGGVNAKVSVRPESENEAGSKADGGQTSPGKGTGSPKGGVPGANVPGNAQPRAENSHKELPAQWRILLSAVLATVLIILILLLIWEKRRLSRKKGESQDEDQPHDHQ